MSDAGKRSNCKQRRDTIRTAARRKMVLSISSDRKVVYRHREEYFGICGLRYLRGQARVGEIDPLVSIAIDDKWDVIESPVFKSLVRELNNKPPIHDGAVVEHAISRSRLTITSDV